MEHHSVWLLLYLACSLPACCWAFTCFEGTGCGGDSRPEAARKGDCCAGVGLSFTDAEQQCFECFSEAAFSGAGSEFFLAFFNNLFPGPFFSRAGVRLSVGAVGEGLGQDRVPFMVETSKDLEIEMTGEGGTPTEVPLDTDIRLGGVGDRDEGVCVRSPGGQDLSIVAYAEEFTSADTFKVLPCVFLPDREYEYFVVSVPAPPPDPDLGAVTERSAFAVVPSEDETAITLTLTQRIDISSAPDLVGQIGSTVIEVGQPVNVTLDRMQSLYISSLADLTGSRVVTNKPVAFIVGHECGNIPVNATFCDQMVEQIPPTATWGFNFLSAPIANRIGRDIFKAVPSRSSGSLTATCVVPGSGGTEVREFPFEQAGRPVDFPVQSDEYCTFVSTVPVLLLQFSTGTAVDNVTNADPFMVIVPPTEQYQNSYQLPTFQSLSTPGTNFFNIFVPAFVNRNQVFLDGNQVTELLGEGGWVEVPCVGQIPCSLTQLEVTNVSHVLSHSNPDAVIGVIAYWLAFRAGHGYVGGMTQRPIALPRVTFRSTEVRVREDQQFFTVQLMLDGFLDIEQSIEVFIRSRDGTAIVGEDYNAVNASVIFDSRSENIIQEFIGNLAPDDVFPEANKSFEIFLTASPGAYLFPDTVVTVTILNDDPPLPVVNISFATTQLTVREGEGIIRFRLLKADDTSVPGGRGIVRVMLTTADGSAIGAPFGSGDYQPLDQVIEFDVADTELTVMTTITDNDILEGAESFTATIIALEGPFPVAVVVNATVTVEIVDDDFVVFGFSPALYTVIEGQETVLVAVQLLFGRTDIDFGFSVISSDVDAVAGEDYGAVNTTLSFGVDLPVRQTVVVTIVDDNLVEFCELFRLRLAGSTSGSVRLIPDTAEVVIRDSDRLVVGLDGPAMVTVEEGEIVEVTVRVLEGRLSGDARLIVGVSAVGRTAIAGADYQEMINSELVFSGEATSQVVRLQTTEDQVFEERETFLVLLSLLSCPGVGEVDGQRDVVTIVIDDDDVDDIEFDCFQAADCTGIPLVTRTLEACCTTVGLSFQLRGGVDICQPCILVGFSQPVYDLRERELPYTLTVTVVQGNSLPQSLSLAVTAMPLTASPSDYQVLTSDIALLQSESPEAEVRITLPQEPLEENDDLGVESFTLLLSDELELAPANVFFRMAVVNIEDAVLRIGFVQESYTVQEGLVQEVSLVVSSNGVNDALIRVQVTLVPGTATPGINADYIQEQTILTFPPDSTQQSLSISIVNDDTLEMTEQFTAQLSLVSGGGAEITQESTTIIIDDDDFVVLEFDQPTYSVTEGGRVTATVLRSGDSDVPRIFSFTINTQDGTATAISGDYSAVSTTAQLPPSTGSTSVSFIVEAFEDSVIEGEENFFISLSEPSEGARVGEQSRATVVIEDLSLTVGFEETFYTVDEGETLVVCVVLTPPLGIDRSIFVQVVALAGTAVGGVDHVIESFDLTFSVESSRSCGLVSAFSDSVLEPSETFDLFIINGTSGLILEPIRATVTIFDLTIVAFGFEFTRYFVTEGLIEGVEICVQLLGGTLARDSFVTFSTVDGNATSTVPQDYSPVVQTLTFGPSETQLCVSVPIVNDDILESTETFNGSLTTTDPRIFLISPTAQVAIFEDPNDRVVIGFEQTAPTVQETDESVELCAILRNGTLEREAIVQFFTSDGTAMSQGGFIVDYEFIGIDFDFTLDFFTFGPSSSARQCVTVNIIDDDVALESAEDFFGILDTDDSGVTLDPDTARVVIDEVVLEDRVTVEFEFPNYTVQENNGSVTVCVITSTGIGRSVTIGVQATSKTTSNAATPGVDFIPENQSITFPASRTDSRVCTSIGIIDDIFPENFVEQFNVEVILPSFIGLSPGENEEVCVTITDDDQSISIGFEFNQFTVTEGEDEGVEICVQLFEGTLVRDSFVTFSTIDGTATSTVPQDYSPVVQTLTFGPSETRLCVFVPIVDDDILESTETFNGTLTTTDPRIILSPRTAQVAILEDPNDLMCVDPVNPVNGVVTINGNSIGDTATYACNPGFEIIGTETVTCTQVDMNTAEFLPEPPVCRPLCPDPVDIVNGMVTFTGNSVGDTATYGCDSGFELIGDPTTTCTQVAVNTAEFSPAPPVCRPLCPDPVDIVNGFVVSFTGNSVGDTATYDCDPGFELIGDPTTTCTRVDVNTAGFSPAPPVCRPLCPDPVDIFNGFVVTFTGNSVGDTATYTCGPGFELIGDPTTTCTQVAVNTAEFSPAPPVCRPLCPDPVGIINGIVTFTGNSVGDTATYACDPGFELIGDPTTTCTVNTAEFSPAPPVCRPLCPDPVEIINGIVTFTGNSIGDTATYACDPGFELIGDPTTTCTIVAVNTAEFSPAPPVCRPLCPDPVEIINGIVTFTGNSVGDTATYACDPGFELIGDLSTTCTQVDVNTAEFQPAPPVCRLLCPDPVNIVNGMVSFTGNSVGDTATYDCDPGFNLIGDPTTTCTQVDANSASFQPTPPVCSAILIQIGFDPTFYTVSEDAGSITLRITKTGNNVQAVSVDFSTQSDSAVEGEDFDSTSQTVTFGPSDTEMFVTVPIVNDNVLEMTESFFGILTNAVGMNVMIVEPTAVVNITDDGRVVIGFEQAAPTVQETDESVELCAILRNGTLEREAIVTFFTSDGTATSEAPADYEMATASFTFGPSSLRQCATVNIVDDVIALEGAENFFANLNTTDPGVTLEPISARVFIESEDGVTVQFEVSNYTVPENSGSVTVCVITSTGIGFFLTVGVQATPKTTSNAATPGVDFEPDNRGVLIASGTTGSRVCTNFVIIDDFALENTEQFNVELILPSFIGLSPGENQEACVSIIDDEEGVLIGFEESSYSVAEGLAVEVCVRVIEGELGREAAITVFTENIPDSSVRAGINYFPIRSDLILDSQNDRRCVNISTVDDPCIESTGDFRSFSVIFTTDDENLDTFRDTATVSILGDPTDRVAIGFEEAEYSFQEDEGAVEVCAALEVGCFGGTASVSIGVSLIDGSAMANLDYQASSDPLRFDNGTTRACIAITIVDDTEPEDVEFFNADLLTEDSRVQVTQGTTRINIIDEDPLGLMCFATSECSDELFSLVDNITECCGVRSNYYRRGSTCAPCAVASAGSDFSIGFLQNFPPPDFLVGGANNVTLIFTTPELEPVSVTVSTRQEFQRTLTVVPGETTSLVLPASTRVEDALDRNKGVRILTEEGRQVSVYGSNAQLFSVAGFHAIPCNPPLPVDTYEFYAVSVPAGNMTNNSAFLVVACEDNTAVTFTPTQVVSDPGNRELFIRAGESTSITLNQGETLYISSREDLTGSRVVADKQVSFFSGHECAEIPAEVGDCDHLVEQIPPTALWGLYFLTAPIANRSVSYIARIVASEPDTDVGIFCDGNDIMSFTSLNAGDAPFVLDSSVEGYCFIGATKPILFVQFTPGNTNIDDALERGAGDPFMAVIPANNHYARIITLATLEGQLQFQTFVNVFSLPPFFDPERILLDGNAISTWVVINCETGDICGYAAQVEVQPGAHTIVHQNELGRVGAIVYGLSFLESYGFVGGLELGLPEFPVSVGISQETYEVLESDEEVAINISVIIGELRRNVSLRFIPEDGTAVGLMDYNPTVLDIVLTPRVTQLTLRIPIINDNIVEEAEHFTGSLVSDDVMIFLGTTRVNILDDDIDQAPTPATTNEGGEFYVGFIPNYNIFDGSDLRDASVFIISTENRTLNVDITGRGIEGNVLQVRPGVVTPSSFESSVINATDREGGVRIQVQSQGTVAMFAANQEVLSLGGFMALPCPQQLNVQQYEYYAVSVQPSVEVVGFDVISSSGFLVVSCSDNTVVTITPSQQVQDPNNPSQTVPAGGSTIVTLTESGQSIYIASRTADLTGSRVVSNRPISFFTGHECAFPSEGFDCDHIIEQVPATATWGTTFLIAPIRTQDFTFGNDIIKMVSSRISTAVNITCVQFNPMGGGGGPGSTTRDIPVFISRNGDSFNFTIFNEYCSIEADKPILVVEMSTNRGESTALMSLIPAISQYRNDITFAVISLSDSNLEQWANIFVPPQFFQPSNITLNGIPLPTQGWTEIPCSSGGICGYARQEVILGIGAQSLRHANRDAVLGVIVYGHTFNEGYGYPGGLQLPMAESLGCTDGDVRLVNGDPAVGSGRVEICFGEQWGTVCNDFWDTPDARVVCTQLGFESERAFAVTNSVVFGQGTGPIFLDDVMCAGNEVRLADCVNRGIGISNCGHNEDVGVICLPPPV